MHETLHSSWARAWHGLHASGDGLSVRDAVLSRYSEPHRRYHTLQHLHECLGLFDSVKDAPDRPAEVEMALWFHDAVYELKSSENEEQSAAWAQKELLASGVSPAAAGRVRDLILITRHTGVPSTRNEKVLIDIDLSILGAPPERFAEYELQIREEYSFVPSLLFRLKRRAILQSFLSRAQIYSTPALHSRLEVVARENLAKAIAANAA